MGQNNRFTDKSKLKTLLTDLYRAFISFIMMLIILGLIMFVFPKPSEASELDLNLKIEHTSNPTLKESGYGLNAAFVELEYTNHNFIIAGALGVHSESSDCPEVCFGDGALARVTLGYSFNLWSK